MVTDVDDTRGQAVADKILAGGSDAIYLHQDVTLEDAWPGVIATSERRFGHLDIMVATPG